MTRYISQLMTNKQDFRVMTDTRFGAIALLVSLFCPGIVAAESAGNRDMQAYYQLHSAEMKNNAFNEPMHIESVFKNDIATGEIFAQIDHSFPKVVASFVSAFQWCQMLELHINVKACYVYRDEDEKGQPSTDKILLFAGRDFYQPVQDAYMMNYRLSHDITLDDYVKTALTAKEGPFGTSDYSLEFEAIPLSDGKTFIHFKYTYHYGFMASMAISGYLATLGRGKVGFSVESYDEKKQPQYVKGMQGIVERNSMRYFLAIRTVIDTNDQQINNWDNRITHWYKLAYPYQRQLLELEDKKYLNTKKEEFNKRVPLESALAVLKESEF